MGLGREGKGRPRLRGKEKDKSEQDPQGMIEQWIICIPFFIIFPTARLPERSG